MLTNLYRQIRNRTGRPATQCYATARWIMEHRGTMDRAATLYNKHTVSWQDGPFTFTATLEPASDVDLDFYGHTSDTPGPNAYKRRDTGWYHHRYIHPTTVVEDIRPYFGRMGKHRADLAAREVRWRDIERLRAAQDFTDVVYEIQCVVTHTKTGVELARDGWDVLDFTLMGWDEIHLTIAHALRETADLVGEAAADTLRSLQAGSCE